MFYGYVNPTYFLFALPALILGLWAQWRVRSAYKKYRRERNRSNLTGREAATILLRDQGLSHIAINEIGGNLSDNYDPRHKVLNLSQGVAQSPSVAALGIVAHEVGHAVQDQQDYFPLKLRGGMVPVVRIGSWLGPIVFMLGLLLAIEDLALVGLVLFSGTLVFSLVTLPVELNASNRAVAMLTGSGLVSPMEEKGVRAVLNAAALTYVAAAVQSLMTVLYYASLLGGRRSD